MFSKEKWIIYVIKYARETPQKPYAFIRKYDEITKITDHSIWKKTNAFVSAFDINILPKMGYGQFLNDGGYKNFCSKIFINVMNSIT